MIAKEQPLYFKIEAIAEVAISDQTLRETVIAKIRESLSGAGEAEYQNQSYWNEYSQKGMEDVLELVDLANVYGLYSHKLFIKQKRLLNSLFFLIIAIDTL